MQSSLPLAPSYHPILSYNLHIVICFLAIIPLKIVFDWICHSFYQVFVGARLHVTGGVLRGGRAVEGEASIAGNLCLQYITNFFYHLLFLPCHLIYFLYACVRSWLLFIYTVLDTAAGVWLDRNGIVSSSRSNKGHDYDPSLELMRRCRHAAAAVGVRVYVHGGLRGGEYLH